MRFPLAYHITWGTYGTRLHGACAPHVDRQHNQFGAPFAPTNPDRESSVRARMKSDPVTLTNEQRMVVEQSIENLCLRYRWQLHACAAKHDHVHAVVSAPRVGDALRDAVKAVASRELNKRYASTQWWAEKGSAKYIWDEGYLKNAVYYVARQRDI